VETIELQLDEQTLAQARKLAAARQVSVEEVLKEALSHLSVPSPADDRITGMFADEPELLDQIVEEAMQAGAGAGSVSLERWIRRSSTRTSSRKC
jgi:hypothetical protein